MTGLTHFITNCLSAYYWIEVAPLPAGADIDALVYKVRTADHKTYFIKLKRGHSHDVNVAVIELLQKAGVQELIPPIKTVNGNQTQQVGDFTLFVYPFIEAEDGFTRLLADAHWIALGRVLKQVHEADVPPTLQDRIRRENFSSKWRNVVRALYAQIKEAPVGDEVTLNLWKFLQKNGSIIQQLVDRSEELSQKIRSRPLKFILCHSDIHGGNVLIDDKDTLYIVDWDESTLAPKERDLMFIGGGIGNVWNKPHEEKLFYQGYGQTNVDRTLLTYYRFERIVEDIAVYSQELLLKPTRGKNRVGMYKQFTDMFAPNGVVDIAFETDKNAPSKSPKKIQSHFR